MKIKKSVDVLGMSVPVKIYSGVADESGQPVFGYYDPNKREIVLNSNQTKDSLIRTFLHEMGHAWLDRIGIRVAISSELKEVICEGYANLWYDNFLKKRPRKIKKVKKKL